MNDLIKRADAIKAMADYLDLLGVARRYAKSVINKVPSAEKQGEWIPIKWHEITDEERERENYPKDWSVYLDCQMPDEGEEILVTTTHGYVEKDECGYDDMYYLDSGWDWIEDITAWMPLPKPYKEGADDEER